MSSPIFTPITSTLIAQFFHDEKIVVVVYLNNSVIYIHNFLKKGKYVCDRDRHGVARALLPTQ